MPTPSPISFVLPASTHKIESDDSKHRIEIAFNTGVLFCSPTLGELFKKVSSLNSTLFQLAIIKANGDYGITIVSRDAREWSETNTVDSAMNYGLTLSVDDKWKRSEARLIRDFIDVAEQIIVKHGAAGIEIEWH